MASTESEERLAAFEAAYRANTVIEVPRGFLVFSHSGALSAAVSPDGRDCLIRTPTSIHAVDLTADVSGAIDPLSVTLDDVSFRVLATSEGPTLVTWAIGEKPSLEPLDRLIALPDRRALRGAKLPPQWGEPFPDEDDRYHDWRLELAGGLVVSSSVHDLVVERVGAPVERVDPGWYSRRYRDFGPRLLPDGDTVVWAVSTDKHVDHSWVVTLSASALRDQPHTPARDLSRRFYPMGDPNPGYWGDELEGDPAPTAWRTIRTEQPRFENIHGVGGNLEGSRVAVLGNVTACLHRWPDFSCISSGERLDQTWVTIDSSASGRATAFEWIGLRVLAVGLTAVDDRRPSHSLLLHDLDSGESTTLGVPRPALAVGRLGGSIVAVLEDGSIWETSSRHPEGRVTGAAVHASPGRVGVTARGVIAASDDQIQWYEHDTGNVGACAVPGPVATVRTSSEFAHAGIATSDRRAWTVEVAGAEVTCLPWNYTGWKGPGQAEVIAFDVTDDGLGIVDIDGETRRAGWWSPSRRESVGGLAISPTGDIAYLEPDQVRVRSAAGVTSSLATAATSVRFSHDGSHLALITADASRLAVYRLWGAHPA